MTNNTTEMDEPLTPAGRLFLQPEMKTIVHCVLGAKHSLDVPAIRSVISNAMFVKHPRFSSLLVVNKHGQEHWRKTNVDLDRHIIIKNDPVAYTDDESAANEYIADLSVSVPLSNDKPLWEIHILTAHRCAVVRVHHALGDGISLMSLLLTICRRKDDPDQMPTVGTVGNSSSRREGILEKILRMVKVVWFTAVFMTEFVMRVFWKSDKRTAVSGGDGVDLWPRKLATARFLVNDMKTVKSSVPNATINDVLFAVIASGLSKYLDIRSPKELQEGHQMTGLAMVNLRPQPVQQEISELMKGNAGAGWGNKFGMVLLPVYYQRGGDPLEYLRRAKAMIDKKKLSYESLLSYGLGYLVMNFLGAKYASLLNYRIICNTTFTFSNMIGPTEEITIAGIPVEYIRISTSSLPHAITMHMISYAGKADMQILVAKDIIPDPEVLAKCYEQALLEMKEAAVAAMNC